MVPRLVEMADDYNGMPNGRFAVAECWDDAVPDRAGGGAK
jgi:hypothetical protein